MKDHYEIVVIGSGYGGGISASRLSRAGRKVCLLERGKEYLPGEFPDNMDDMNKEMQFDTAIKKIGSPLGLFDYHISKDLNILVGCGLGGTSLINANVGLHTDERVFNSEYWPKAFIDDIKDGVAEGYKAAENMIKPVPYPDSYPPLDRLKALSTSAKYVNQPFYRTPIYVNFEDRTNHIGVEQKACVNCGDCVAGCNYTAKNTTQMNYLPDAVQHGTEIFTKCNVSHIEKDGNSWKVHFSILSIDQSDSGSQTQIVKADIVIVSAGTVGSSEIMLRSKANGLALSDQTGMRLSGNGDVLGFTYNTDHEVNGLGFGPYKPGEQKPVGPGITGIIDTRKTAENYKDGFVIEEGSIPGAMGDTLPIAFAAVAALEQTEKPINNGLIEKIKRWWRQRQSFKQGPRKGAVLNTQTYLLMGHDEGDGQIKLNKENRVVIDWPGVGDEPIFQKANDKLQECNDGLNGRYLKSPLWTKLFHKNLISVHPLGGCIMGENVNIGVVNHKGQVFDAASEGAIHQGLYISDGSIVPTALGVNPSLTISAISERNVKILCEDRGWTIDYSFNF